jgi:hypothetical protein
MTPLATDVAVIAEAVQDSDSVEVNKEGTAVRRVAPLPDKDDSIHRTVYVKQLPTKATIEDVSDFFGKFGTVRSVRLRFRRDKTPKGSAFVEFSSNQEAESAVAGKLEFEGKELLTMLKCVFLLCLIGTVLTHSCQQAGVL